MNILSLSDSISCGQVALKRAGIGYEFQSLIGKMKSKELVKESSNG